MAKRGGKTGGGTPPPNTVPDDVISKLAEKQKEAMEALRKEMQDFSEQSSKSFEIAAAAAALFGDKLGSAAEKSETSSQSLDGLTNSLKKMGKAQDDAAKSAGFKKKGSGQDGQSSIFAQVDQSSKKAKVSVTAFGVAVQGLGKAFKALTSFVGGAFDVIKSVFSFITDVAMGVFDFFKGIYEGLFEMAQEQRKYATENRRAAEEIRENFGDISKGTGKAVLDFGRTLASASIAGLGAMQVFENAAEAIRFANEVASAAPAAFDKLQDQFKGQRGANIIGFAKGLGISTEQLGGLMSTAIATGRTVEGLGTEMTKYSKGLSSRFGVDSKLISKSMTKAMLDVKHFANATVKEIGQAAVYAHKLGVELSDITGILDAFDTFDQAAENVSKLSQAFGVNIDAMELVSAKTPADALAKVKAALDAAGKSADQMNRQELKLLASTVHMDEATVRQTLSNQNQGTSLENIKEAGNSVEKQMMSTGQALKEVSQDIKQVVRELQTSSKGFFETFLDGFLEGVATSSDMRKVLGNLQQAIEAVFAAGRRLGVIFVETFPGVKKMLDALASFFNPSAVGGMFNGFTDVFGKFFKKLQSGTGDVKNLFSDLWKEIKQYFTKQGPAGSEFLQGITEFWNAIKQIAATAITAIGDLIADAFTAIADAIENGVDTSGAKSAAGKLLAGAKKEFSPIGDAFMQAFTKIKEPMMRIIDQIMTYLGDKLKSFFSEYKWEILAVAVGPQLVSLIGSAIATSLATQATTSAISGALASSAAPAAAAAAPGFISALGTGLMAAVPTFAAWFASIGASATAAAPAIAAAMAPLLAAAAAALAIKEAVDQAGQLKKEMAEMDAQAAAAQKDIADAAKSGGVQALRNKTGINAQGDIELSEAELESMYESQFGEKVFVWTEDKKLKIKQHLQKVYKDNIKVAEMVDREAKRNAGKPARTTAAAAEEQKKKDLQQADEMFKKTSAEMGLTTVDNVEERIKKIQDIGAKLTGGKEAFEKSMNTIRETLKSMNFSLWTNAADEEKFKLSLVGLTQISTFTNTINTSIASLDKAGELMAGMGDAKSGVIGKFINGFDAFKVGFADLLLVFAGGTLSNGKEVSKFGIAEWARDAISSAYTHVNFVEIAVRRFSNSMNVLTKTIGELSESKSKFSDAMKDLFSGDFTTNLSVLGEFMGPSNDLGTSLVDRLGTPADITGLEEKATAWGESVAKILEVVSESLSADITESINTLLTSLSDFNTKMGEALAGGITANIPVKVETDAGGKMKVANPAKTVTTPNGQMKMEFHFKIEMNARELEKVLVTPNDSIIVTTLNGLAAKGPGATVRGIQNQGIEVVPPTT